MNRYVHRLFRFVARREGLAFAYYCTTIDGRHCAAAARLVALSRQRDPLADRAAAAERGTPLRVRMYLYPIVSL